jgi:hypothetical protein
MIRLDFVSERTLAMRSSRARAFNMKRIKENIYPYRVGTVGRTPIAPRKSCAQADGPIT